MLTLKKIIVTSELSQQLVIMDFSFIEYAISSLNTDLEYLEASTSKYK